jgi:glycyl-tRNA synthetase beta chain
MTAPLLIELLTEELPPKNLHALAKSFAEAIFVGLQKNGYTSPDSSMTMHATPRRLAVTVTKVLPERAAQAFETKLMPRAVALDTTGNPTPALLKKMAALGLNEADVPKLITKPDGKADALFYVGQSAPVSLGHGLQALFDAAIAQLPIAKVMTYQTTAGANTQFVRPVHGIIALHGTHILPISGFGIKSDRITRGHRFLSSGNLIINDAANYSQTLADNFVVADYTVRRNKIRVQLLAAAGGDTVLMPDALLDEVASLVEWPVVYAGHFEEAFLAVPQECLILTMQQNQKYFALTKNGQLCNRFLIVSNLETDDPSKIIEGNERVIRPRLSDARFFFEQDKKTPLATRTAKLANVVYHNKLGSQADRAARVAQAAAAIAPLVGASPVHAKRAAELAKADLVTDMVGEFPELQGLMGRYYATHDKEASEVAAAIEEQYLPRFAGDALPKSAVGLAVALADKLETLTGLFGIGQQPAGDKDPFALRRHALGVLRMMLEIPQPLSLAQLIALSHPAITAEARTNLLAFFIERLRGLLRDQGFNSNEIESVTTSIEADPTTQINLVPRRLTAVRAFMTLPEAENLAAANKRIGNILKKSDGNFGAVNAALLQEPAERALQKAIDALNTDVSNALSNQDYTTALQSLASLRAPVDAFFETVMVNAEDLVLRQNRLNILAALHKMMNAVADLSKLVNT